MKIAATFICGLCVAGTTFADPYVISKQQAHRAADQSNAQQGVQPHAPAPTAPPTQAPMDPALAATLQSIGNLRADIAAFNVTTNEEATQKISLLNHLSAAAHGTKPSSAMVKKLAGDLVIATTAKKIPAPQQNNLARDIHALFNSSHLTAAQQQTVLDDVQKILTSAGTSPDDAANVIADLKAIAAETK